MCKNFLNEFDMDTKNKTSKKQHDTHDALHGELTELHAENQDLREVNSRQQDEIAAMKAYIAQLEKDKEASADIKPLSTGNLLGEQVTIGEEFLNRIQAELETVKGIMDESHMTGLLITSIGRMRLQGAGERRYGFIEKVWAMSRDDNAIYYPAFSNYDDMNAMLTEVELLRNIVDISERIRRVAMDHYLVICDAAYNVARMYYRNVREAARAGDTRAEVIFNDLRTYYERMGRRHRDEPTEDEIITDVKGLLHGSKTGRVAVVNESDTVMEGEHKIVDNTKTKGKRAVMKDDVSVEVEE